jgi:hypothetical protein
VRVTLSAREREGIVSAALEVVRAMRTFLDAALALLPEIQGDELLAIRRNAAGRLRELGDLPDEHGGVAGAGMGRIAEAIRTVEELKKAADEAGKAGSSLRLRSSLPGAPS